MSNFHLFAKAGLVLTVLASATAFGSRSFADDVSASSGASGTVSANASGSGTSGSISTEGSVSFQSGTQATGGAQGDGAASSKSGVTATAEATAIDGNISLALSSGSGTSVSSNDKNKFAIADADAAGTIGPAHVNLVAHAEAKSGPDQLTATAKASDGSFALAQSGVVRGLSTFVPGGTTTLLQNGSGFQSVSCNVSGTCSYASVTNDSVSASIRIFANTGSVTVGNVNAILSAFLSVEASAGRFAVSSTATSSISGSGISTGKDYVARVSGKVGTTGYSTIWRATSTDNNKVAKISAQVWLQGEKICASTKVHLKNRKYGLKTIVKCKKYKNKKNQQKVVFTHDSHKNWFANLFD